MSQRKPSPADAGTSISLGVLEDNISYLTRALRSLLQQSAESYVSPLGLLPSEITALSLVAANEGMSQNELARALVIKKSQVTGLVRDLVERGHLSCVESPSDRRYNALSLTSTGRGVWKQARQAVKKHNQAMLKVLAAEERTELTRLLRKLLTAHIE